MNAYADTNKSRFSSPLGSPEHTPEGADDEAPPIRHEVHRGHHVLLHRCTGNQAAPAPAPARGPRAARRRGGSSRGSGGCAVPQPHAAVGAARKKEAWGAGMEAH